MVQQAAATCNVFDLQCSSAAKELAEQKKRNREIIFKLLRSVYFLMKNRIPQSTNYKGLVELQIANGDKILEKQKTQQMLSTHLHSVLAH